MWLRCQCWGPCQCTLFSLPASHSLGGGLKRGHRVQVKHTGILKEEKARENSDLFSNVGPLRREGTNADLVPVKCVVQHISHNVGCVLALWHQQTRLLRLKLNIFTPQTGAPYTHSGAQSASSYLKMWFLIFSPATYLWNRTPHQF